MITVGLIQADIKSHGLEVNLKHYEELLMAQITEEVNLLVFPEMFNCGFSADFDKDAEKMNGRSMEFLYQTARYFRADVVATLPIKEEGRLVNRLVWLSPDRLLGCYDKRHLFLGSEQALCASGTKRTIVETLGQRWLPLICYDVRFPVWSRNSFTNNRFDYDCLIYTANFPAPREQALLKLAAARAIENQAFALVVNRIGCDGEGHLHKGGTTFFSPEGEILAQAKYNQEQVLVHQLDFEQLVQLRKNFPIAASWDK
ncbi:MAG: hypothetical protein K5636_05285 [Bacteroidales bacterium]|nr:hypothetical protein [Bacteroidales bacterium]